MKKFLSAICIFMIAGLLASCSSKEEKMLTGTWTGTQEEIDEDAEKQYTDVTLTLNDDEDTAVVKLGLRYEGVGTVLTMTLKGSWMADDKTIDFFFDEDDTEVKATNTARKMAEMEGVSIEDIERQAEENLKKEIAIMNSWDIVSLSDDTLVVDMDGKVTLHKK